MNQADREKTCLPLLETAPGFAAIPSDALRFLAGGCYTRRASRGQVLCERGGIPKGFFVLVSGRVKLSILSKDGAERVLDIVLPGRTFAETASVLEQPCPLHAEALVDSQLVFVDIGRVREAIELWPQVANLMLAIVARRAQHLTADLEACCLHSAAQRVAGFLLRDADCDPRNADVGYVTLPAAKTVVASSLNLTAETFSRELHALARRGLVEVERREIRIPSLQRLRKLAGVEEDALAER
jgi:CRP-like cAMP-binding protein